MACSPACLRTPEASNIVIMAKIAEMAKIGECKPDSSATPVDKAVTAAEWELGIPPVLVNNDQSSFFVAIKWIGTLMNWAKKIAANEAQKGKFINRSILGIPFL